MIDFIPPKWTHYSKIGEVIPNSKIITFKTPLRKEICAKLYNKNASFTLDDLVSKGKAINLSLVIDLANTKRFYCSDDLVQRGIKYIKIVVVGGGRTPRERDVLQFCDTVKDHLNENPDSVVGVHCTHGVNRTGYFVCRYMIDCLGFAGPHAVELFEEYRGHNFDHKNLRMSLMKRMPSIIRVTKSISTENEALTEVISPNIDEDNLPLRNKRNRRRKHHDTPISE